MDTRCASLCVQLGTWVRGRSTRSPRPRLTQRCTGLAHAWEVGRERQGSRWGSFQGAIWKERERANGRPWEGIRCSHRALGPLGTTTGGAWAGDGETSSGPLGGAGGGHWLPWRQFGNWKGCSRASGCARRWGSRKGDVSGFLFSPFDGRVQLYGSIWRNGDRL